MWPVVGHRWAVEFLERALPPAGGPEEAGRVPHALLFTGPPQVGKRTLALAFAQALNCQGEDPPCGECLSCRKIARGNHADVRVIGGQGATIKIEQVRALRRELALSPVEGRWRVAVFLDFETVTPEAANALLKTLEEPPERVVLVLTAADADMLLPTIVSRCQVLPLRRLAYETVRAALVTRWGAEPEQAELLARLSGGCMGWAVDALAGPRLLEVRKQRLDELQALLGQGRVERLRYAQQLSQDSQATRDTLVFWLTWWRDIWLLASGASGGLSNVDQIPVLQARAASYTPLQAHKALLAVGDAIWQLEHNVNLRLALEVLMLSLPNSPTPAPHVQAEEEIS
jgi:DNA polymerase-3 subunit delta'